MIITKKATGVEEGQNEGGGQSTLHKRKEEDLLVIHWRWSGITTEHTLNMNISCYIPRSIVRNSDVPIASLKSIFLRLIF